MKLKFSEEHFLGLTLFLGIFTAFIALALYAYLGTFSRYGSDDYCNTSFFLSGDLVNQMVNRYLHATSRYSNILFIGVAEKIFGWYNVAILPLVMIILFVIGTYIFLDKIKQLAMVKLERPIVLFISISVVFFSLWQAPNLFETLYWRSAMATHFAPLVFMLFLGTFLLHQIGSVEKRSLVRGVGLTCLIVFFLVGGFSEPPAAVMITILFLGACAVWWRGEGQSRRSVLIVLLWSLTGALMALLVMAFAPANSLRLQTAPPGLLELVSGIIRHSLEFIVDTLRTLPIPTFVSIAVPAVLFYLKFADPSQNLSKEAYKRLGILMIAVLLIAYLLIAASFAPSVYGQSYPVARARFAGRLLMTSALMINGALLGVLVVRIKFFQASLVRGFAILALMILALYPLRAAWRIYMEIPAYQQRAADWDLRDSEIRALKDEGVQDLIVRFLPDERIQDLGDHTGFRLNRCAAILYGVNSIVAVPMQEE